MPTGVTSERFLGAQRRNRLESYRLEVARKHIERETVRMNCDIEREKRLITKAFKSVTKTSGVSDHGRPPRNDKDTSFEKCPSFRQGLRLSNKRLFQWKDAEKQLNKFIFKHEHDLFKTNRKYIIPIAEKRYEASKLNKKDKHNNDDVFLENDIISERVYPMDLLQTGVGKAGEFDVRKWEKQVVQGYKDMVRTPSTQRLSSPDISVGALLKLRSKSSPTIATKLEREAIKRVRPHTAHARIRNRPASGKSLPTRPTSAQAVADSEQNKFLITKDGTYIRQGNSFEKLSDGRPVERPPLVNNYLEAPTGGMTRSGSGRSINSLCPVHEDNEDDTHVDGATRQTAEREHINGETAESSALMSEDSKQQATKVLQKWRKFRHARARSASSASVSSRNENQSPLKHSKSDQRSSTSLDKRTLSRHESGSVSSTMVSRRSSLSGSVASTKLSTSLGISGDIEEFSKGQEKLVSEVTAEKPVCINKLVSIASVVKAALTFSKLARKRALNKLVEENNADSHEVVRQERLRQLRSRQNLLSSIGIQWQLNNKPAVEDVETVEGTSES